MRPLAAVLLAGCAHVAPAVVASIPEVAPSPYVTVDGPGWDAVCTEGVEGPQLRLQALGAAVFLCGDPRGRVVVLWPDGEVAAHVDTALATPTAEGWTPRVDLRPHPVPVEDAWRPVACPDGAVDITLALRTRPDDGPWHRWDAALVALAATPTGCVERVVASCPPPADDVAPGPTVRCGAATVSAVRQGARWIVAHEDNRGLAVLP